MRHFATRHRFSAWAGGEAVGAVADDVLGAMVDDLMAHGDLRWALRNLLSRGMTMPDGGQRQGLRDMLRKLRERKRARLDRLNLGSAFENIEKQLDEILDMERATIDGWLREADPAAAGEEPRAADPPAADFSNQVLREIAQRNRAELDALPETPAGRMQQLERYEFLNQDAQRKFVDLLNQLRRAVTQTFFDDI